ncbi:F-box only protein 2 [Daphnia magna]|uniref:F-box only protein 2 n=1 Tax=Daphnia magna TaxID=35525 RepID=A0A165AGW5_9CRUS|nr:F-box only protein 2 [Daphnia magna]
MSEIEGCRISSEYNGLYFCNTFIARELVALILTQVDYQSLIASCRLVCKQWNSIITDPLFWKHKTVSENRKWPSLPRECNIPWSFYASVYIYDTVDRNLIRNPNGKYRLQHWIVLSKAGDGFAFEQPPVGSDIVPLEAENDCKLVENACFATSYHSCSKEQIIDLSALGFFPDVLKQCKPNIYFKDWYAGRFDCGCVYECTFSLLDEAKNVIDDFQFRTSINQWEGREWHKVEHCFKEYPESVRYVKFYHGGTDRQFWAGHYGAKMTGASVVVSFS